VNRLLGLPAGDGIRTNGKALNATPVLPLWRLLLRGATVRDPNVDGIQPRNAP
jgi:hypothetical protein